ncbi:MULTISPECIES: hypothetical protein [unclassified Thiocapsa]|uniref:hypothetical protein n=1 Tax=unclassified Thiocapsa TaxID=2641286 RepID=UPI0035AF1FF4
MLILILPNLVVVHIADLNRRRPIVRSRLHRPAEVHIAVLLNIRLIDLIVLDVDTVTGTLRPVAIPIGLRQRYEYKQKDTKQEYRDFHT